MPSVLDTSYDSQHSTAAVWLNLIQSAKETLQIVTPYIDLTSGSAEEGGGLVCVYF